MKQLKMTLWMLLCILTMTACGGDDDDLGYKGIAVEKSEVVGKTLAYVDLYTGDIYKLKFIDGKKYTFTMTDYSRPYNSKVEKGAYTLAKKKGYTLIHTTKDGGGSGRYNGAHMYYKDYDKDKVAIFIDSQMFVVDD